MTKGAEIKKKISEFFDELCEVDGVAVTSVFCTWEEHTKLTTRGVAHDKYIMTNIDIDVKLLRWETEENE